MRCFHKGMCILSEATRILPSFILCATLVLSSCHSQAKATADLVPAAERGDVATVQDCLSKKANIENGDVSPIFACNIVLNIFFGLRVVVFVEKEHFEGCELQRDCLSFLLYGTHLFCLLCEVERITRACV